MRRESEARPGTPEWCSGFTLVELLVASLVLVVGIVGMMAVFPETYRDTTDSGTTTVLGHLATEKLEELRSLPYDDGDLSTGTHPAQAIDSKGQRYYPVTGFDEDFSLRWTVSAGPTDGGGNPVADIKTVVVEATYATRYSAGGTPIEDENSLDVVMASLVTE